MANYVLLDYIQSNGQQYIDTGIQPNMYHDSLKIVVKCSFNVVPTTSTSIIGAFSDNQYLLIGYHPSSDTFRLQSGPVGSEVNFTSIPVDTNIHTFTIDQVENYVSIDDVRRLILTAMDESASYNIYGFGTNNEGTIQQNANIKLYSLKIYANNKLIRDYTPMLRLNDNEAGLYDLITSTFAVNQGTGAFTYITPTIPTVSAFIPAIYDRSQEDIDELKDLNSKFRNNTITPEEVTRWTGDLKGALNSSDWERVLNNQQFLAEYYHAPFMYQTLGEFPRVLNYTIVLKNMQSLKDNCPCYVYSPDVPPHQVNEYSKWNDIEKILADIEKIRVENISAMYFTGEELYLDDNILI